MNLVRMGRWFPVNRVGSPDFLQAHVGLDLALRRGEC
jgi:hypothetical protein